MFNIKLILILLNIKDLNRKIIIDILKYPLPISLEVKDIYAYINNTKIINHDINSIDILKSKKICNNIISYCNSNNIKIITILDDLFPSSLKTIKNPPLILFYKGNLNCILYNRCISIVGSREACNNSKCYSKYLGYYLGSQNITVISGLAKGCDEHAHLGCIQSMGNTVAVLPCGIDNIYPKSNIDLADKIISSNGCILSEYPPGNIISKSQFIERNRLISALSTGVIVVEYTYNSGTMHTINYATQQNKSIYYCNHNLDLNQKNDSNSYSNLSLLHELESLNSFLNLCIHKSLISKDYAEQIQFEF